MEANSQGISESPSKYNIISLCDTAQTLQLFEGISIMNFNDPHTTEEDWPSDKSGSCSDAVSLHEESEDLIASTRKTCSTCGVEFTSRNDQVQHFKLEWHRFNLKRRLHGEVSLTQEEYLDLNDRSAKRASAKATMKSESAGVHSKQLLSGIPFHLHSRTSRSMSPASSTTSSTDTADDSFAVDSYHNRHAKIFFVNAYGNVFSVYRCVLHSKKEKPESEIVIQRITDLPHHLQWAILMVGGGHFAGAVFHGKEVVVHKTIHKYTVRAKQGSSQGIHDSRAGGSQPKSAGANLRRYNEAALLKSIQELLQTWHDILQECSTIYYRASSYNRIILFGGRNAAFQKSDPRLRSISFPTRRASFKEVQRAHHILSSVECYGDLADMKNQIPKSPHRPLGDKKPRTVTQARPNKRNTDRSRRSASLTESDGSPKITRQKDPETVESSGSELDIEVYFDFSDEEVSFSHLREFEWTHVPMEHQSHEEPVNSNSIRMKELRSRLYTACKVGNINSLQDTLNQFCLADEDICLKYNQHQCEKVDISENKTSAVIKQDGSNIGNKTLTAHSPKWPHASAGNTNCRNSFLKKHSHSLAMNINSSGTAELPELSLILNETFGRYEMTLLHVASRGGHYQLVSLLLENGADPTIIDCEGRSPYSLAPNRATKLAFRRYMGDHPEKYDYTFSQIPSPISEDQEALRAARVKERRCIRKKNHKARQKERKEQEILQQNEELERQRFLNLSDSEKIITSSAKLEISSSRCFQCGMDITGKIPFEYNNFKFCTVACVKTHRQTHKLK